MINNIRRRKHMTIDEKLKEEEEYSQKVENKIKYFSTKVKEKKEKVSKQENLIEFMKEMNFFKQKQKKIENELLLMMNSLEENNEEEKESTRHLDQLFEIINMEKSIQSVFNKNCMMVTNMIRQGKQKDFMKKVDLNPEPVIKVLDYLNSFNKQLVSSIDTDLKGINYDKDEKKSQNIEKEGEVEYKDLEQFYPLYKFIFNNDYYNIFEIYDINYILLLENYFNKDVLGIRLTDDEAMKFIDLSKHLHLDKLKAKVDENLISKTKAIFGENETEKIGRNLESLNELTYMKYYFELKDYLKDISVKLKELNKNKFTFKDCLKFQNIFIFFKSNLLNRAKYTKRLEYEFPSKKREDIRGYEEILTIIYNFKQKRKAIQSSYIKELAEITLATNESLENNIETEMNRIKKSVDEKQFEIMSGNIKELHKANTEKYEKIKQKQEEQDRIKQEKFEEENRIKMERNKQHADEIKILANSHKNKKQEIRNQEKKQREAEMQLLQKKVKEEIKKNKPKIEIRQQVAENEFIHQQKHKDFIKQEKLKKEIMLEEIIQNLKVRPNIPADPERVKQVTECMKLRKETVMDEADKVVLFRVNGFSVNQLMNDMRYKISSALHDAGMLNTPYAQDLLKGLSKK